MTTDHLEFPVCALCGSEKRHVLYSDATDLLYSVPGQFAVVRCSDCGLIYLCPRPKQRYVSRYYPEHYGAFQGSGDLLKGGPAYTLLACTAMWLYRLRFGHEATSLSPFGQRRMLDVGCGAGQYLHNMQELGWDVYGVDLSPIAVRAANERIGPGCVWEGTIQVLDPGLNEFDLITMNHCLEHVPDPSSTLDEVYRRLSPTGKVKIIIPDVSGFEAKIFHRHWVGLDVPRHLLDFSRKTLAEFLRRSGLQIESCRPQMWPWSVYGSFELSVEKGLHLRWQDIGEVARSRLMKLLFLLAMLSYSFGNRGAIEVIARKIRTQAQ